MFKISPKFNPPQFQNLRIVLKCALKLHKFQKKVLKMASFEKNIYFFRSSPKVFPTNLSPSKIFAFYLVKCLT